MSPKGRSARIGGRSLSSCPLVASRRNRADLIAKSAEKGTLWVAPNAKRLSECARPTISASAVHQSPLALRANDGGWFMQTKLIEKYLTMPSKK